MPSRFSTNPLARAFLSLRVRARARAEMKRQQMYRDLGFVVLGGEKRRS